jgi:molybdate transport system substrate-binding protein
VVFTKYPFFLYTWNSLVMAAACTALGLAVGLPAVYSIARWRQQRLAVVILVARIIPGIACLIPWYIFFRHLRMVDTYGAACDRIPAVGVARVDAHQPGQKGRAMIGKRLARNVAAAIGLAVLLPGLTAAPAVSAAEIKVMSTVAMSATLDELKPKFEAATDHKVTFVYSVIADLRKRIQEGETADVMILSRAALDDLQGQGKVASGSIVNVASSYVAIAVRAGATKPDIGSVDALKRTLLAVKSIVYADPAKGGASGVYFAKVLDRLGITDQMKVKTVLVPGAQAADVVARGEAEMGVAQASEIVPIAGAQLVGPLPGDLNNVTIFSAGIGPASKDAAAAKAFIQYVTGPVGAGALKSKGMDPS